jgi:hypothetical protein
LTRRASSLRYASYHASAESHALHVVRVHLFFLCGRCLGPRLARAGLGARVMFHCLSLVFLAQGAIGVQLSCARFSPGAPQKSARRPIWPWEKPPGFVPGYSSVGSRHRGPAGTFLSALRVLLFYPRPQISRREGGEGRSRSTVCLFVPPRTQQQKTTEHLSTPTHP